MTQPAVGTEIHKPLDVHRELATKVALHLMVTVDIVADALHLGVREGLGTGILCDPQCRADLV